MKAGKQRWFGPTLAVALVLPACLTAQDEGGQILTVGISPELSYQTNPDLTPGGGTGGFVATTGLSLSFSDATPVQSLSVTANTGLRTGDVDGPTVVTPVLGATYSRNSADKVITLNARGSRSEVNRLTTLEDFTLEDGTIVLPPDFLDLDTTLTGTLTRLTVGARLEGGRTRPLGYNLSANLAQTSYDGAAAASLSDSQTLRLGAGANLKLDDVTTVDVGLNYTRFDPVDEAATDQLGLTASWRRDRPLGPLTLSVGVQDVGEDPRYSLNASRTINGPRLGVTFGAGVSLDADGTPILTGATNGNYALPEGSISFSARRTLATTPEDDDIQITSLSAGISRNVTPRSQISTSVGYFESERSDTTIQSANIAASYSYELSPDWALTAGARYETRIETDVERASNESIFMSLGRSFTFRP